MATKVYKEEEIELQSEKTIKVRPLKIRSYRKFMESFEGLKSADTEDEAIDIIMQSLAIAVNEFDPDLVAKDDNGNIAENQEQLEDEFDIPSTWKVLEVAAGIEVDNPNLQKAGLVGRN